MKKLLVIFLFASVNLIAQIDKTEPPFWFAGMHNPELQIMFYGKNIAQHSVTVSNNIPIKNVVKTENPNYLFITIDTKNISPTDITFSFKQGKKTFTKPYSLKQRRQNSALRESYDSSDVIYLLMPDRFANGNPNNDSTPQTLEKADR